MKNIFLTGEVGIGKSTVIDKALALLPGVTCGGFRTISAEPITEGALLDVFIESTWKKTPNDSAHLVGTRWGDNLFTAYPAIFDDVGVAILASPPEKIELLLMDELGVMESDAGLFKQAVLAALQGPWPVLGVIKPKNNAFLDSIRAHEGSRVIEVTEQNREELPFRIAELLKLEIK